MAWRGTGAAAPATLRAVLFLLALCAIGIVNLLSAAPAQAWFGTVLWVAYVIVAGAMLWTRRH